MIMEAKTEFINDSQKCTMIWICTFLVMILYVMPSSASCSYRASYKAAQRGSLVNTRPCRMYNFTRDRISIHCTARCSQILECNNVEYFTESGLCLLCMDNYAIMTDRWQGLTMYNETIPPGGVLMEKNDVDGCAFENACYNGGTCVDGPYNVTCYCDIGYKGNRCTVIGDCISNPCQNKGLCNDMQVGYTCTCHPGFSGVHCETGTFDCVDCICGVASDDGTGGCGRIKVWEACGGYPGCEVAWPGVCKCGPYGITTNYFIDCSTCGGCSLPKSGWQECSMDEACARQCVQNYLLRYATYCSGKAPTQMTCEEMSGIHSGGLNGCQNSSPFTQKITQCCSAGPDCTKPFG